MRDAPANGLVDHLGKCSCGKTTYRTRKVAKQVARRKHMGENITAYECDTGKGWHLGHKTAKGKVRIRERRDETPDPD